MYDYFAEHENLAPLLGAKIKRINDGTDGTRNGVGSVRELRVAPLVPPFQETVTEAVPGELIRYEITKGSPLKDHRGEMRFSENGTGTTLRYEIAFNAPPGLAQVIAAGLKRNIAKGLKKAPGAS